MQKSKNLVPSEVIENKILLIRGKKVILDKDLAGLYGVLTKNLNKAVKRNPERFPDDFMFQLTLEEAQNSRFQFGTLKRGSGSNIKYLPFAFTEQGVSMLSSVLNSPLAIQVNIQIMRTFTKLREIMLTHKDLQRKIEDMERNYDHKFSLVFDAIKQLLQNDEAIHKRLTYEEDKEKNKQWGFVPRK